MNVKKLKDIVLRNAGKIYAEMKLMIIWNNALTIFSTNINLRICKRKKYKIRNRKNTHKKKKNHRNLHRFRKYLSIRCQKIFYSKSLPTPYA